MAKKNNIGLGLAALAVGAGAVAAVTKGHKAEVKKEERKAAVKAAKQDYRNTELGRYDKTAKASIIPTVTTKPSQDLRSPQEWTRRTLTS